MAAIQVRIQQAVKVFHKVNLQDVNHIQELTEKHAHAISHVWPNFFFFK